MSDIDRRMFLQVGLAVAVSLTGCGGGATQSSVIATSVGGQAAAGDTPSPSATSSPSVSMFPGLPDAPDLTAEGELPPTEIPDSSRFFGADPASLSARSRKVSSAEMYDHIVVIMLENRAFDHMMGYLYSSGATPAGQTFNGVVGSTLSNAIPSSAGGGTVPVTAATSLQTPIIDPAEEWATLNLVLFNQFNPSSNQNVTRESSYASPYNLPDGGAYTPAPMSGFVTMFLWTLTAKGDDTSSASYETIMQCFTPNLIPVISQLAQNYAICDQWYTAVPSQTNCNRSFFHAASSSGHVNNSPYVHWVVDNKAPTIFDSLTKANVSWTIYWDRTDIVNKTRLINYPTMSRYPVAAPYFKSMAEFYEDVFKGNLPAYSFIQPRFMFADNSFHPYYGAKAVKRGEILLNDIYQAIRQSNTSDGSNYLNTLLVITFDEGGTCYDHESPPTAVAPGDGYKAQYDFGFDRLGQRVPTILVSPWIAKNTVISTPLDATSVIRTLQKKYNLSSLTSRDAASTALTDVITPSSLPRTRAQMPRLRVRKLSDLESVTDLESDLNEVQDSIVQLVNAITSGTEGRPPGVKTVRDALRYLASVTIL